MNMVEDCLGKVWMEGVYVWKILLNSGILMLLGLDFLVELVNLFYGLYVVVIC